MTLLTFGYVKENYKYSIPIVITELIESFYDKYFRWKIQKDKFKQLLNAQNGDILDCKSTFKIKDIRFRCRLFPNGQNAQKRGSLQYYLVIDTIPSYIKYFSISAELGCLFSAAQLNCMIQLDKENIHSVKECVNYRLYL